MMVDRTVNALAQWLIALVACLWTGCVQADVESAVRAVARRLWDKAICQEEARKLVSEVPLESLLDELLKKSAIFTNAPQPKSVEIPSEYGISAAADALILAIKPFPFEELATRYHKEKDSFKKTNLLWLMHLGTNREDQGKQVVSFAAQALADERPGVHTYTYIDPFNEGPKLRVCDLAYKILELRWGLYYNVEAPVSPHNTTTVERNNMLDWVHKKFGISVPKLRVTPGQPIGLPYKEVVFAQEGSGIFGKGSASKRQMAWIAGVLFVFAASMGYWLMRRKSRRV